MNRPQLSMFDEGPIQLWTARPNGELDWVSGAVLAYFGRSHADMLKWGWADLVHPDDLSEVGEKWSLALESREPYRVPFRLRRADGEYLWHLARAEVSRADDGAVRGWVGANVLVEQLMADR